MIKVQVPVCLLLTTLACGCSPEAAREVTVAEGDVGTVSSALDPRVSTSAPADYVAGYRHSIEATRFAIGKVMSEEKLGSTHRWVGTTGVFALNEVTGCVRAILNSDAETVSKQALTNDGDVHNARVRGYFLSHGLAHEQVSSSQAMALMGGSGATTRGSVPSNAKPGRFTAYYSVIYRQIAGVPVPDSFATARFNDNDEAVSEWVYWPPIPRAVLLDAQRLQRELAVSPPTALLTRLPREVSKYPMRIAIRHSNFDDERSFSAFASIDVTVTDAADGRERMRHFDGTGRERTHPSELPIEPALTRRTRAPRE